MLWGRVSSLQVRKFRTLTELILDAQEHVKNPYKGKKLKVSYQEEQQHRLGQGRLKEWAASNPTFPLFQKHPDFPKKPLTPYFRFFMEKRAKYAKLHPEMSNLDLTKILSKKYKELPEKKKVGGGGLRCGEGSYTSRWEQLKWVGQWGWGQAFERQRHSMSGVWRGQHNRVWWFRRSLVPVPSWPTRGHRTHCREDPEGIRTAPVPHSHTPCAAILLPTAILSRQETQERD